MIAQCPFCSPPPPVSKPRFSRPLSQREAQVLKLIGDGKSNTEMGDILDISRKTVDKHREHIYRVTGIKNAAHAVQLALYLKLVEPMEFPHVRIRES